MPKGPRGNDRLTSAGPFTYDEEKPPEVPSDFQPPSDIMNPEGDFRWYKNWVDKPKTQYGLTGLYDPEDDLMIVENRLKEYKGGSSLSYTHDDMVVDLIEKSPLPKFPSVTVPAEAGGVEIGDTLTFTGEIPTAAGGAFVTTERLNENKELIEKKDKRMTVGYLYKYIYTLALLDFPPETIMMVSHNLGTRMSNTFIAERRFQLKDAYMELRFNDEMPESKVEVDWNV